MTEEDKENIELFEYLTAAQNIVMKKIMRRKRETEPPSEQARASVSEQAEA